jgi:predicted GNAT family acetyltransferase
MRMLKNSEIEALLSYVYKDEAYNIFIIGDAENFGLEGEHVSVAVFESDGRWECVVLRYEKYFVVYSQTDDYDANAVAAFINGHEYRGINGKNSVIVKLVPYFPELSHRKTILARCDAVGKMDMSCPKGIAIRPIVSCEVGTAVSLYCQIPEFRDQYLGNEKEQTASLKLALLSGATAIGAFAGGRLVSFAMASAQNSHSAMITSVCTHRDFLRRGLATCALTELCRKAFESGLKFLCLFYDNPQAGRIYERVGFHSIGAYAMLTPAQNECGKIEEIRTKKCEAQQCGQIY